MTEREWLEGLRREDKEEHQAEPVAESIDIGGGRGGLHTARCAICNQIIYLWKWRKTGWEHETEVSD